MKISELNQDILDHLFGLYKEITGSSEEYYPKLEDVLKQMWWKGNHDFEYRAGSRWWGHSKFRLYAMGSDGDICVYFEPNAFGVMFGKGVEKQIKKAEEEFSKRAEEYMKSLD